jgi:hypothetical protein
MTYYIFTDQHGAAISPEDWRPGTIPLGSAPIGGISKSCAVKQ